ncbi:DUF2184 domain-containing protein [Natrinema thermotolerans]|uniref:DUF2184 domain-containing protein n=1 Tax=Natrinema thermotolerans TaxID=121872 RepID=A0AAF0PAZ5_9EURY|nr:DUF2184 domain-containing protein [Natrinema thermotolerans]WMT07795.1 DUF2184 domain-containing protein [Natrinema thermotolerans]WMT08427.1 DUF2184 domain-containing protein [Natrinema thermotolerans]
MATTDSVTQHDPQMAEEFEGASRLHETALFNPVRKQREQAWKQIRAQSPLGPDMWDELDQAIGIKQPSAELTADSAMQVDSWQEYAETILDDQFVQSTVIDQLIGAGFGVSASLFRYAYFDRLRATRLEANRSMNARARSVQEMPANALHGVPLWIHHVDYEFDSREVQNAMQFGDDLDTSVGQEARRALNRSEHGLLWNGEGREIPTDRGTLAATGLDSDADLILQASGSNGWVNSPEEILADFKELHDTVEDQTDVQDQDDVPLVSEVGGWIFVPRALWGEVDREDYETSATDEPIMERLERKYPYLNIVPAPRLDADSAILLLNDPRYFQMVVAQGVTNTNWEVDGGFGLRNKTLSSRTPFVRRSPDGVRGIARITGINA